MNLVNGWPWLPVLRKSGARSTIEPWQIATDLGGDLVVDVVAPRADFKGAIYQFLIGLLQTAFAPDDGEAWLDYWREPPSGEALQNAFAPYLSAFELDSDGPMFMQDFDLPEGEPKEIAALLIEAPGGKTLRENLDHFVKGGRISQMAPQWAAMALFTLQINAPSGGVGHRVSLRGGGPLTTLILPDESDGPASLWHKLWLNVLARDELGQLTGDRKRKALADIFPWLAPTRTSEPKTGVETQPGDCHPLQMYWAMPRRIRLGFSETRAGHCDLTGEPSEHLVSGFLTKNYGVNYTGPWVHPLTPYAIDAKTGPLSIKGQPGGVCYRNWLGLVLDADGDGKIQRRSAMVVQAYLQDRQRRLKSDRQPRLWAFGYDMDNMKARCWYEATLPIFPVPRERRDDIHHAVQILLDAAQEALGNLRSCLKQAWFSRPKEAKGDFSFLDRDFWQITEAEFYRQLEEITRGSEESSNSQARCEHWQQTLRRETLAIFDHWALSGDNEDGDLKRVVQARAHLEHWLYHGKEMKWGVDRRVTVRAEAANKLPRFSVCALNPPYDRQF
jgi:CRISPR system Cascade subunit CasA